MATPEIEVIGGGIFGLTIAYTCLKRGARVRLIEKTRIGAGASGGVVGALSPHTPDNWNDKKQFQFESLIKTGAFWAEVDAISGQSASYARFGRIIPIPDQGVVPLARSRTETAVTFWQGRAEWQVITPDAFPDWSPESPTGLLTYDTLSARISPQAACASLAAAFTAKGGQIILGETEGRGADATILCTGYEGLAALSAELGQPVGSGIKGQGILLKHKVRELPQIFADGVHIIPHSNGTVAIGSTSERDWTDPTSTDEQLDALLAKATAACPRLANAPVLQRWAGVRPRSLRRTPMLGRHPTRASVFIANGGFKIGFGIAVRTGEVMADLVLDGHADIPEKFTVEANL